MIVHLFGSSVRDYLGTAEATIRWHHNAFWRWFDLKLDVGDHRVQTYAKSGLAICPAARRASADRRSTLPIGIFTTEQVHGEFTRYSARWLLRGQVHLVLDY